MTHSCVSEETSVALAEIDVVDAEDALDVEEGVLDLAEAALQECVGA